MRTLLVLLLSFCCSATTFAFFSVQGCIPSIPPRPVNARKSIPPPPPSPCASRPPSTVSAQDAVVCLERVAAGTTYLGMAAHPDGSGRAFLYTQDGKIWLATVPARGANGAALELQVGGVVPFLDLTDRALRLTGLALHAKFTTNGRYYVSYYAACDTKACGAGAAGRSAPSAVPAAGNGPSPSRHLQLVVAEFSAKGVDYGMATRADPVEVSTIFSMGLLPHQLVDASDQQHGGQILFRDGYLYLVTVTGHAAAGGEANNRSSSIIRFNVDSTMPDNEPEIFATGLGHPRGCSFDSQRPSYLYCAGVDEQGNEQLFLISDEAANYSASPPKPVVSIVISHGRPTAGGVPSIVGGIIYRGSADPFLSGRYLYMYGFAVWAAVDTQAASTSGSGLYASASISVRCSGSSLVPCGREAIAGGIVSLAEDNSKDAFVLATSGVYRVMPPGLCGAPRRALPSWLAWVLSAILGPPMSVLIYLIWARVFGGSGGAGQPATINWHFTWNCFSCCITTNYNGTSAPNGGGQGDIELARRF